MKRRIISAITAGAIFASTFSGCNGINPVPDGSPTEVMNIENRIKFLNEDQQDYKEIVISEYFTKVSDISHKGMDDLKADIFFEKGKNYVLGDISEMLGYPVIIEEAISLNKINFNGRLSGSLVSVLDYVASLSNSYWTNKRGVIRFQRKKSIVYSIPLISTAKTSLAFNAGSLGGAEGFDIGASTDGIFDEIKNLIISSFDDSKLIGQIGYSRETLNQTDNQKDGTKTTSSDETASESDSNSLSAANSINDSANQSRDMSYINENSNDDLSKYAPQPTKAPVSTKKGSKKEAPETIASDFSQAISVKNKDGDTLKDSKSQALSEQEQTQKQKTNQETKQSNNKAEDILSKKDSAKKSMTNSVKIELEETFDDESESIDRIKISKDSGVIQVNVTPAEEERIDNILNTVAKNMLSSLVVLDFFILEVETEKIAEFNQNFEGIFESGVISKTFNFSQSGGLASSLVESSVASATGTVAGMAEAGVAGMSTANATDIKNGYKTANSSRNLNYIISYLTGDKKGEVLTQPKIVTLSNRLARLKEGVDIPYIKPGTLTGDSDNVVYQIETISTGLELGAVANVLEDGHIMISLGIKINQYLGDKTLTAGTLGTYELPIQAPKVLNSTFRVKPGEILVLGGSNKVTKTGDNFENLFVPTAFNDKLNKTKFMILALPRITKFVKKGE